MSSPHRRRHPSYEPFGRDHIAFKHHRRRKRHLTYPDTFHHHHHHPLQQQLNQHHTEVAVHFAPHGRSSSTSLADEHRRGGGKHGNAHDSRHHLKGPHFTLTDTHLLHIEVGPIAAVYPPDVIAFPKLSRMDSPTILSITNLTDEPEAYKIMCSTPSGYTVKPTMGFLHGRETVEVAITLHHAGHATVDNDKFLVAVTQIEDYLVDNVEKLDEIWRSSPKDRTRYIEFIVCYYDVRLTCGTGSGVPKIIPADDNTLLQNLGTRRRSISHQINKGLYRNKALSSQLSAFIVCQLLLAVVVLLCVSAIIYAYYFTSPMLVGKKRRQ